MRALLLNFLIFLTWNSIAQTREFSNQNDLEDISKLLLVKKYSTSLYKTFIYPEKYVKEGGDLLNYSCTSLNYQDIQSEASDSSYYKNIYRIDEQSAEKTQSFSTGLCLRYVKCILTKSGFIEGDYFYFGEDEIIEIDSKNYLDYAYGENLLQKYDSAYQAHTQGMLNKLGFVNIAPELAQISGKNDLTPWTKSGIDYPVYRWSSKIESFSLDLIPDASILVYGGGKHGHIEIKVEGHYYSDYKSDKVISDKLVGARPLIGVYYPKNLAKSYLSSLRRTFL